MTTSVSLDTARTLDDRFRFRLRADDGPAPRPHRAMPDAARRRDATRPTPCCQPPGAADARRAARGRPSCATCGSRLGLGLGLRGLLAVRPPRRRRLLALLLLALAAADAGGHLLGLHHLERHLGLLALRRAAHEDGAAGRQLRAQ